MCTIGDPMGLRTILGAAWRKMDGRLYLGVGDRRGCCKDPQSDVADWQEEGKRRSQPWLLRAHLRSQRT